ncbi:MAG TPA: BON domain-containing protein [Kofleriaceae bacterium]|jgi:osmotically-inducible protein OsmY|nr:BON domain-containing protein [Kofleriaceae bacterium]
MANRAPRSYDEIVRRTVPNPDSSWRPTSEEERRSLEGWLSPRVEEQVLRDDIHDVLILAGIDATALRIDVDRSRVVVRGEVRDRPFADRIIGLIEKVPGVTSVVDQLSTEH